MNRILLLINLVLAACLAALWGTDRALEVGREARRAADSAFHALGGEGGPTVASVARLDLTLPGSGTKWTYVRSANGWHIPQFRQAFALGQEIDGLLKSLLETRGTAVGTVPRDAEHFGISPGRTLEAELFDAPGSLLLHAIAGRVAPGQRSGECFITARGREAILHMNANPWSYVAWKPEDRGPPLLDARVIPLALGRGLPARIVFTGDLAPAVRELIRKEVPREQLLAMGPDRGPRFEWYGTTPEGEKRLNDNVAFAYSGFLSGLLFDDLLGQRTGDGGPLGRPALTVTLHYDGEVKDSLVLAPRDERGQLLLLHATTGQVFHISAEKAKGLVPDAQALLELPPPRPAPPPQPQAPAK